MDETSLQLNKNNKYSVITSETKNKAYRTQVPNGKHLSAVVTISAKGNCLKTLLILPQKTLPINVFEENNLTNYGFATSQKGFINKYIFYQWVRYIFIPEVEAIRTFNKYPKDKWALLVLDGHGSRADLRAIHLLQQHFIDYVVIPGHSSHILQPLDVGVFKYFKQELKKQQRHKKNFYLVLDHCLNLATSTMRIVEAFNRAGVYPLNLNKNLNNKPIFPAEIKEFAFSNSNKGSRLRISGQILTSENFIEKLTNKEKRIKASQRRTSRKHIPPSKLFQKLFANMQVPFNHIPISSNETNTIRLISQNSSIENFHKTRINKEDNYQNQLNDFLETGENQIEENTLLLNENRAFLNNINLNRDSTQIGMTIQPQLLRFVDNNTNIHENYDNVPPIEPSTRDNNNELDDSEVLTSMSPGRTSIRGEKTYLRTNNTPNRQSNNRSNRQTSHTSNRHSTRSPNRQTNRTPNRHSNHSSNRQSSHFSNRKSNRTPNRHSNHSPNRHLNRSSNRHSNNKTRDNNQIEDQTKKRNRRNGDNYRNSYRVVKNKLYQKNRIPLSPVQKILEPSNRSTNNQQLIEYHQKNNLNNDPNVFTDYYQPLDPQFRNILLVQEQRQSKIRINKENVNSNLRRGRGSGHSRGRGRGHSRGHSRGHNRGRRRGASRGRNRSSMLRREGDNNSRRDSNYYDPSPQNFYQRTTPKQNRLRRITTPTRNKMRQYIANDNESHN
ncbi:jerky protein [Anaeramoeba flamelloides]|uniref:Jerky protein n=1 Tax=Anaeramoeba flamelloides TaxID=1746091 RepID=A0AAV7Y4W7_9EUKA|nr:jerky protein [Anaeramoeba flamelloides]